MAEPVLRVEGLHVHYLVKSGTIEALHDISLDVPAGGVVGVVGESGSGKSTLGSAMMRLLPPNAKVGSGSLVLQGRDLFALPEETLRRIRGRRIGMIFQDPVTSLNPTFRISSQMINAQRAHTEDGRQRTDTLRQRAVQMLERVGIADAERRIDDYPHQFSGGMLQRIMIATVLLLEPDVLICDEATSALDVTLQAQILDLLKTLCREEGTALVFISHDMGVIAEMAHQVSVLYNGRVVESGSADDVLIRPQHPYTRKLLAAIPSRHGAPRAEVADRTSRHPLLEIRDLHVHFHGQRPLLGRLTDKEQQVVTAVDGVDLTLDRGEIVGLVGESGSGKTTLGKALLRLAPITSGVVNFDGTDLATLGRGEWRRRRRRLQMIFQEPYGSLSPRMRVDQLVTEPYRINRTPRDQRYAVTDLLELVHLPVEQATKYPHQLSGGQARRVGIARVLAMHPDFIVADEPTSGLDVSAASAVLDLLQELRDRLSLSLLLITHDLNVVGYLADRIAVMYQGKIVEHGTTDDVMDNAQHPYTRELLASIPKLPGEHHPQH
ncbi:MAG: dipeptide ABC transporter ATP-binding protein [Actinophytocola sp.]|nr:dipeptide ABC transporter ATP-binding protein [Actinophytocola sp.]